MHKDPAHDENESSQSSAQVPSAGRSGLGNIRAVHADHARASSPLGALAPSYDDIIIDLSDIAGEHTEHLNRVRP